MPKEEPTRSCIACRTAKGKNELLRFVLAPDGTVVPDIQSKLPGRGAYTCLNSACVMKAASGKQFARAFKTEVRGAGGEHLVSLVAARMEERIASYLSLANKAGKVVSGSAMVMESLKGAKKPGVVFLASDISADIGEKVLYLVSRAGAEHFSIFDKDKLGSLLGKGLRSVVALQESGFVEQVKKETERFRNFLEGGA